MANIQYGTIRDWLTQKNSVFVASFKVHKKKKKNKDSPPTDKFKLLETQKGGKEVEIK